MVIEGAKIFAWIIFVVGAIWVPIKFHKKHHQSYEQKALFILGILPGSVILIILGVYENTHGNFSVSQSSHQALTQYINTQDKQVQDAPLECGVIQAVSTNENYVELEIRFEPTMQTRRFIYDNQGQKFQTQRRICIRQDSNISTHDARYLRQLSEEHQD